MESAPASLGLSGPDDADMLRRPSVRRTSTFCRRPPGRASPLRGENVAGPVGPSSEGRTPTLRPPSRARHPLPPGASRRPKDFSVRASVGPGCHRTPDDAKGDHPFPFGHLLSWLQRSQVRVAFRPARVQSPPGRHSGVEPAAPWGRRVLPDSL